MCLTLEFGACLFDCIMQAGNLELGSSFWRIPVNNGGLEFQWFFLIRYAKIQTPYTTTPFFRIGHGSHLFFDKNKASVGTIKNTSVSFTY